MNKRPYYGYSQEWKSPAQAPADDIKHLFSPRQANKSRRREAVQMVVEGVPVNGYATIEGNVTKAYKLVCEYVGLVTMTRIIDAVVGEGKWQSIGVSIIDGQMKIAVTMKDGEA